MEQCKLTRRRAGQGRRGGDVPGTINAASGRADERVDEVVDIATRGSGWAGGGLGKRCVGSECQRKRMGLPLTDVFLFLRVVCLLWLFSALRVWRAWPQSQLSVCRTWQLLVKRDRGNLGLGRLSKPSSEEIRLGHSALFHQRQCVRD